MEAGSSESELGTWSGKASAMVRWAKRSSKVAWLYLIGNQSENSEIYDSGELSGIKLFCQLYTVCCTAEDAVLNKTMRTFLPFLHPLHDKKSTNEEVESTLGTRKQKHGAALINNFILTYTILLT